MRYERVTEEEVYQQMARMALELMNPVGGAVSLKTLAGYLKTSRYQVKKHMDNLKRKGWVELKCFNLTTEEEVYPPYWGYVVTNKGRETDYFMKQEKLENELREKHFGVSVIC